MSALWLVVAILCLLTSAFYSGSEMGLYCVNRLRLRLRARPGGDPSAGILLDLAGRPQETVLAVLLSQNVANYLQAVATSMLLVAAAGVDPDRADFYTAAILSPVIFVLGDVVPKNWFQLESNRLMPRCARVLRGTVRLFNWAGILWFLGQMVRLSARLAGHDEREEWAGPRGEVIGLLREGAAEGAITEEQTRIVEGVMNLSSVCVGSIMVPRARVACVVVDTGRQAFRDLVRGHDYSRMPVLSHDRRTVLGIVNVYDVLSDETGASLQELMRPPLMIQARETAASALVQLQRARATLAIVTDPRHGFVGIVTLKDVVEEIFGELRAW